MAGCVNLGWYVPHFSTNILTQSQHMQKLHLADNFYVTNAHLKVINKVLLSKTWLWWSSSIFNNHKIKMKVNYYLYNEKNLSSYMF